MSGEDGAQKRPASHRTVGRSGIVGCRLSHDELVILDDARKLLGLTRSAYLRAAIRLTAGRSQLGRTL